MATIDKGLVGQEMRLQMECKKALKGKGWFYVGTGGKDSTYKDIPETTGFDPGTTHNGVLIRDTTDTTTNTTGWKVAKITADNLEGGRVVQATNADKVLVSTDTYKPLVDALLDLIYPIGSIYMSVRDTNPADFLGGTWERWGQGKVPVGVDVDASDPPDTDFATVEKTGGEKQHTLTTSETPKHTHDISVKPDRSGYGGSIYITTEQGSYVKYLPTANSTNNRIGLEAGLGSPDSVVLMSNIGGDKPHNNLQPYITCYMWKRTA